MSDLRAYNIKKQKLIKCKEYALSEIMQIVKDNAFTLLGVKIIKENILLSNNHLSDDNVSCELFGYDESYKLVIFEFRKDKRGALVKKAFMTVDYILENVGRVKMMLKDYLEDDIVKNLNMNPRVIIIGEDFNMYDDHAIKQLPYELDLVKIVNYGDFIVVDKVYQCYKVKIKDINQLMNNITFKKLHEEIVALGDDINATGNENFICYRKLKNVCYLIMKDNEINVSVRLNNELINYRNITNSDVNKVMKLIIKAYEEN